MSIDMTYRRLMQSIPDATQQRVVMILVEHVGKEQAITREKLLEELNQISPREVQDRQLQQVIRDLRTAGYLICSNAGGGAKGYFLPVDMVEYLEFDEHEFESKLRTMTITRNTMMQNAREQLGSAVQKRLF